MDENNILRLKVNNSQIYYRVPCSLKNDIDVWKYFWNHIDSLYFFNIDYKIIERFEYLQKIN